LRKLEKKKKRRRNKPRWSLLMKLLRYL
jgi:hypothetical protein